MKKALILSLIFLFAVPHFALASSLTVANIIKATNRDRIGHGLPALHEDADLDGAALTKAYDEASKGYFGHKDPQGNYVWQTIMWSGYNYTNAGENLAVQFTSTEAMEKSFMASPTHKANILGKQYQDIGVGVYKGRFHGAPTTFVVVLFGSK